MKRNVFKYLTLLALCAASAHTKTVTNKTFFMPRSVHNNLAMEYSTWHSQISKKEDRNWAGSVQATGFFQASTNKSNLGNYFGEFAENQDVLRDYISVVGEDLITGDPVPARDPDGIESQYIFHHMQPVAVQPDIGGKIRFKPYQETYGLRFDYHQNIVKDFYFKASLPVVNVKNNISTSDIGEQRALINDPGAPYAGKNLYDYLKGNLAVTTADGAGYEDNLQNALTHAKLDGKKDKAGVADIDLAIGYNFWKKRGNHIGVYLDVTIPTGNSPKGEFLFEPICGNGQHWAFGGGLDTKFRLWNKKNDSINLLVVADLKYLFQDTEKRTLSLLNDNGNKINFGHYYLGGEKDAYPTFPLANVLTQDLKIRPGLQFEGLVDLAFESTNLTFDIGYNIFSKEEESVFLKNTWPTATYAIANPTFDTQIAFDPATDYAAAMLIAGSIEQKHLDFDAVRHPRYTTHKIYGALGYAFNDWKFPLMLGLGTSYEFTGGNAALENYALWCKAGLSF